MEVKVSILFGVKISPLVWNWRVLRRRRKKKTNQDAQLNFPFKYTTVFKMDNQQRPTVEHRELCPMLRGSLDGRGTWERVDPCICMAQSLLFT